jgi:hypothetical protein
MQPLQHPQAQAKPMQDTLMQDKPTQPLQHPQSQGKPMQDTKMQDSQLTQQTLITSSHTMG